ncbi:MAG TPA: response regulator [Sphingobacteriaceae bacterium]
MSEKVHFIIIDDSELDCYIAEKLIKHTVKSNTIRTFTLAEEALKYISSSQTETGKTIVLLDVLMPIMSGFQFVEEFEKMPLEIQEKFMIIALTTSLNKNDFNKIRSYRSVSNLLDKPLTPELLLPMLEGVGLEKK